MATIKAGTYRFQDALVLAEVPRENEISCSISFVLNTVAAEFGIPLTANCSKIFVHSQCMSYYVESTVPDMTAAGAALPWSYPIYAVEGYRDFGINGWNTVNFDEGIRMITVTEDAEASDAFCEWFAANAVEQKQVSGVWKFNDVLNFPNVNLEQEINFGFSTTAPDGVTYTVSNQRIDCGINSDAEQYLVYYAVSSTPDMDAGINLPDTIVVNYGDWLVEYYGEGVKIIDFGTEPQYVSAEFCEWFTANAVEQKELSGKWRFREVLTPPADAFRETLSFLSGGASFNAMYTKTIADTTGFGLEFSGITASGGEIVSAYADGEYGDLFAVSGWVDSGYRTVDFGTEPQLAGADFYHWLTGNAERPKGVLLYSGETIAEVFPGQTVTIKCAGMKMEDDVVVRV